MNFSELIDIAWETLNPRELSPTVSAGGVAAAILTDRGYVFTGVCIDAPCGLGFCAESAAIAAMVTAGENRIVKLVAIGTDGKPLPPCGRCREFVRLLHEDNLECEIMLSNDKTVTLAELLPFPW